MCREHLSTNTAPVISSKHELANPTSSHDHVSVEVDIWSIAAVNAVRREHLSANTAPIISSKHEQANPTSSHDHISVGVGVWSILVANVECRERLSANAAPVISSKHELANPTSSHDHIGVAKLWPWELKLVYLHHYKLSHPGRIGCFSTYTK